MPEPDRLLTQQFGIGPLTQGLVINAFAGRLQSNAIDPSDCDSHLGNINALTSARATAAAL
jgi:hypothetical protein